MMAGAPLDASGQPNVGAVALQRFFALHVAVLPTLFMPLLGLHLWLVQKHGNAIPPSEQGKPTTKTVPFFPNFLFKDLVVWLLCLNLLTVLAAFFPWELGEVADIAKPMPPGIHPEWYFMSQFELLKLVPANVAGIDGEMVGMGSSRIGAGLWALVPLWDRGSDTAARLKRINYVGYRRGGGADRPHHARLRRVAQELNAMYPSLDIPWSAAPGSSGSSPSSTSSSATSAWAAGSTCRCSRRTRAKRATSRCSPT